MPDGTWTIPEDYLDRATEYEAVRGRRQPVSVAVRSSWSLERQVTAEGATWLDQQLVTGDRPSLAVTGFGKAVEDALAHRRANLIEQGVARERGGGHVVYQRNLLRILETRQLRTMGNRISMETGLAFRESKAGDRIEGVYRRRVDLASGKFAMIEQSKEFSLVPWRPVLERARGKPVSGIVRCDTISWDIGRKRGPSI